MNRIVKILMERDKLSRKAAEKKLMDAQIRIYEGEDPEDILHNDFHLEPDFLEDLV